MEWESLKSEKYSWSCAWKDEEVEKNIAYAEKFMVHKYDKEKSIS